MRILELNNDRQDVRREGVYEAFDAGLKHSGPNGEPWVCLIHGRYTRLCSLVIRRIYKIADAGEQWSTLNGERFVNGPVRRPHFAGLCRSKRQGNPCSSRSSL